VIQVSCNDLGRLMIVGGLTFYCCVKFSLLDF